MRPSISPSITRFVGAMPVQVRPPGVGVFLPPPGGPVIFHPLPLPTPAPPPVVIQPVLPHLPLFTSRNGSLFADRFDALLHWYLSDYALLAGVDGAFSFLATATGQNASGQPFFQAQLALSLQKSIPADAAAFAAANPAATLREIPLSGLTATLTSEYTDDSGTAQQREIVGTVAQADAGTFTATFGPLLGSFVTGLYLDLTQFGKARLQLNGGYLSWVPGGRPIIFRPPMVGLIGARGPQEIAALGMGTIPVHVNVPPVWVAQVPPRIPLLPPTVIVHPQPAPMIQTEETWQAAIPIGLKFQQADYQLKFIAQDGTGQHFIRNVGDLSEYVNGSSEYQELRSLGAIGEKYPTLASAFVGSISRTIVVVPRRYAILRTRGGCAAACSALVDTTPGSASQCKFEFDFTVAPQVSGVEFAQFERDVAATPLLAGYTLKFPDLLKDPASCTLLTAFKTSMQFVDGPEPHTFAISVVVQDVGMDSPAVANANLLIGQMCASVVTGISGSLSLKLDDLYAFPVTSALLLNFNQTVGAIDEMSALLDPASGIFEVTSESTLALQVTREATVSVAGVSVLDEPFALDAGAQFSLSTDAPGTDMSLRLDATLLLPQPLTKVAVAKLLAFETVDVQSTQYVVAIDADALDFSTIDTLTATIVFVDLPDVVPRALMLGENLRADSLHVVIPLQYAVFSLPANVRLDIKSKDPQVADRVVGLAHDFNAAPVLILTPDMLANPAIAPVPVADA